MELALSRFAASWMLRNIYSVKAGRTSLRDTLYAMSARPSTGNILRVRAAQEVELEVGGGTKECQKSWPKGAGIHGAQQPAPRRLLYYSRLVRSEV